MAPKSESGKPPQSPTSDSLKSMLQKSPSRAAASGLHEVQPATDQELEQILLLLQKSTGVNFTLYKHSTLRRRILRRMALHQLVHLAGYRQYLREHPGEVEALYQDVLIKVTGYFRDEGAFTVLQQEVFPEILAAKSPDREVRFWVPGCSSGEEAYSLAICWLEFLEAQGSTLPLCILATDVSEPVLAKALDGLYLGDSSPEVSRERLRRFFVPAPGGCQVSQTIRDMCVFARQDLIQDQPFSEMDLISCRNVLIYLQTPLQKHILSRFYFSLNPTGFLLLGTSETVGTCADLFGLVNKKFKIYRKESAPAR